MPAPQSSEHAQPVDQEIRDVQTTSCCIVGGGPGGMMLALLLARKGVDVMLLETHKDFDRDFRGDTIHPSSLEVLNEIGLADALHKLPHNKIYGPTFRAANGTFSPVDFRRLKLPYPYIMLIPQTRFLEFIAAEGAKYPNFRLKMSANVLALMEEAGVVRGVRYLGHDGWHEVRALLTVGADGRFSKIRHLAGIDPIKTSPPMDILWFRVPHLPQDGGQSDRVLGGFGMGRMLAIFDRDDHWQVGYVFPKGSFQKVKEEGLEAFRKTVADIEPRFSDHMQAITDWHQTSLLSVESSRCPLWHKPGLLLIGDAAHVMSPVGGLGINYAIMDAVVASNLLAAPLKSGRITDEDLAKVQREREWPTRVIQRMQSFMQKQVIANVLRSTGPARISWILRLAFRTPVIRDIPARLMAHGIRPAHVKGEQ